jgi:hypothetical protein
MHSGRGRPHSKTFGQCTVLGKREASWSAAVLCRFGLWLGRSELYDFAGIKRDSVEMLVDPRMVRSFP